MTTEAQAQSVWQVVIEECGEPAPSGPHDLKYMQFLRSALSDEDFLEFRFCGALGFGGKVKRHAGHWYVTCYLEDQTPERAEMVRRANKRLERMSLS